MIFKYCPKCGKRLDKKEIGDEGFVPFCISCESPFFDNPVCVVGAVVINEKNQILLLKSNYISTDNWTLVWGYVKNGETLENAIKREILEETNQQIKTLQYVTSYYFEPNQLIMPGYIAYVNSKPFVKSNEVDDIMWCEIDTVDKYIMRVNNMSGIHFDNSIDFINKRPN